jgi:hypothetical protein
VERLPLHAVGVAIALLALGMGSSAQTPGPTAALVERAGRYVDAYLQQLSALVSEEQQEQRLVRADGRVREARRAFHTFRDVLEVDGRAVRNREDRLRRLFLEKPRSALEQARAIARESERHDIGFSRTGFSPIMPLRIALPDIASGFRFVRSETGVTFQEFRSPSFIGQTSLGFRLDLMARGSFVLDPETGRILAADVTAEGPPPSMAAEVNGGPSE